jgi:diguanylate cyclase (GGDEF)-like protein
LKQWVQKLIEQLEYGFDKSQDKNSKNAKSKITKLSDDRATLLYLIDVYNKNLIEVEGQPVRRVREQLDAFTRELVNAEKQGDEDALFRFRQFFSSYRVAEYTYLRKSFDDFKNIIWGFVDHLSDEVRHDQAADRELDTSLKQLKEAVDADSIDLLRSKSRDFINSYLEHHSKREERRSKKMKGIKRNLDAVRKQLEEADRSMRLDHLTQAFNRRSFDERMKQSYQLYQLAKNNVSLIIMDIDFFKKINDTYGHDIGDFVLKDCVRLLQEVFHRDADFVARIGGEEFAVILPDHAVEHAVKRAEDCIARIRKEVLVKDEMQLRFTLSMGIAQLEEGETPDKWLKRADSALYESKHNGRDRFTVAPHLGGHTIKAA